MKLILIFAGAFLVSGCMSFPIPPYPVSVENINNAKKLKSSGVQVKMLPVTAAGDGNSTEATCRAAGPVKLTEGKTFGSYVGDALRDELSMAETLSEKAPNTIAIFFKDIEFRTSGGSKWIIDSEVIYNGRKIPVALIQEFEGSFMADNACREIANNFPIAVRKYNSLVLQAISQKSGQKAP